jgi:hypothetical protein
MRMRWPRRETRDARSVRHGVAAAIFWLLPLLAFAGVLAPEMIEVVYEEEEEEIAQRPGSLVFRSTRLNRMPLVVSREYSATFVPAVVDIESLFSASQFRGELGRSLSELPSFPSARGDTLVIDDLDAYVADLVFKDLLEPVIIAENREVWDPAIFDVIPALFPVGNGVRYDDFPDPGVDLSDAKVIPEPATGMMVCFGLMLLAWSGRPRAPQRQPITS